MISPEALKDKARAWAAQVVELNNTPVPADMQKWKDSLMKYAKYVKESIEAVFGSAEELKDLGVNQLGSFGFVSAAVIAAAVAAITYWSTDYAKFRNALSERKRLESIGTDPKTAAELTEKLYGSGGGSFTTNLVRDLTAPVVFLGGAWLLAKQLDLL